MAEASNPVRARLVLTALTLAAYANSFAGPFQFDDHGVISNYAPVHSLLNAQDLLGGLRPLLKLSYALSWQLGQGSPIAFHILNLLLHLLNVELVMRLYAAASAPLLRWPFRSIDRGALCVGLLFALHPIQTEAVTYISGRSTSLMTSFVLVAALLYAEAVRSGRALYWVLLAAAAFLAAVLTKETAATLPLVLLAWELFIERSALKAIIKRQAVWWLLGIVLLAGAVASQSYFSLLYQVIGQRSLLESLQYQLGGVAYLATRWLLILPLSIDPGLGLGPPRDSVVMVTGVSMLGIWGFALTRFRKHPLPAFGVTWFVIHAYLPYALLPRSDVVNERHLYLAMIGPLFVLGALWNTFVERFGTAWITRAIPVAISAVLMAKTIARNRDFRSEIALWQSTVEASPNNPRALNNLGVAYESKGRYVEARLAYTRALVLEPRYAVALKNNQRVTRRIVDGLGKN